MFAKCLSKSLFDIGYGIIDMIILIFFKLLVQFAIDSIKNFKLFDNLQSLYKTIFECNMLYNVIENHMFLMRVKLYSPSFCKSS